MSFQPGHIPAHKGRTTTTDPIRDFADVQRIKAMLQADGDVRGLALFSLAVNTAYRVGDLCNLRWEDCLDDGLTITVRVLEGKNRRPRIVPMGPEASAALRQWRYQCESEYVASGQRGRMQPATFAKFIKDCCRRIGLQGSFAAHTTRKTWVRVQLDHFGTSLPVISTAIGHQDVTQTLRYCGKLGDEVVRAYGNAI